MSLQLCYTTSKTSIMSTGKQTPAPKESSERGSAADEAIKKAGGEGSKKEETYPKPSQKN